MNSLLLCFIVLATLTVICLAICGCCRYYPCHASQDFNVAVFGNSRAHLTHPLVRDSTTHFNDSHPTLVVSSSTSAHSGGGSLPPLVTSPNPGASVSTSAPSASNDEADDYKRPEKLIE